MLLLEQVCMTRSAVAVAQGLPAMIYPCCGSHESNQKIFNHNWSRLGCACLTDRAELTSRACCLNFRRVACRPCEACWADGETRTWHWPSDWWSRPICGGKEKFSCFLFTLLGVLCWELPGSRGILPFSGLYWFWMCSHPAPHNLVYSRNTSQVKILDTSQVYILDHCVLLETRFFL
jgi:hypothetical protein